MRALKYIYNTEYRALRSTDKAVFPNMARERERLIWRRPSDPFSVFSMTARRREVRTKETMTAAAGNTARAIDTPH